jgi:hypothetical protein
VHPLISLSPVGGPSHRAASRRTTKGTDHDHHSDHQGPDGRQPQGGADRRPVYIGTFVFSIPALGLYEGVLDDPRFVLGAGSDQGVLWGGLIEVLTGLTGIGTAVALYPVIKRHGPGRALGFVASRTLEAAMIFTGVLAVLAVYTLRQDGGDAATLTTTRTRSWR